MTFWVCRECLSVHESKTEATECCMPGTYPISGEVVSTCPACNGTGERLPNHSDLKDDCQRCNGTGFVLTKGIE